MATIPPDATARRLFDLCVTSLRRPNGVATDSETGAPIIDFVPPLTAQEQTTYDGLLAFARSGFDHLTPTEYANIRPQLTVIRDLRQLGRNAFMQLDANERDRRLYDAQSATTTILLAILRE